jgi:Zn-dependent protease
VQTNPVSYTRRLRMKTGHLLVAAAGPVMNLALAAILSLVYVVVLRIGAVEAPYALTDADHLGGGIEMAIELNFILAAFNLLPFPPLDGGTVLAGVLPDRHRDVIDFLQRWGFLILLGLLATGVLSVLLRPVLAASERWLVLLRGLGA